MLAAPPVPPSGRSFYLVITVASLLVGAAIGAQFAPQHTAPPAAPRVWTERPPLPPPPAPVQFALPPPPPAPPPVASTGMPACDELLTDMDLMSRCDSFPAEGRASLRQSLEQMRDAWRDIATYPPETRAAAEDACRQALAGVRQAASSIHCEL